MNAVPKTKPTQKPERSRGARGGAAGWPGDRERQQQTQWYGSNASAAATPASAASDAAGEQPHACPPQSTSSAVRGRPTGGREKSPDPSDRPRLRWLRRTVPLSTGRRTLVRVPPRARAPTSGNRVAPGSWYPNPVTRPPGRQPATTACSMEPAETVSRGGVVSTSPDQGFSQTRRSSALPRRRMSTQIFARSRRVVPRHAVTGVSHAPRGHHDDAGGGGRDDRLRRASRPPTRTGPGAPAADDHGAEAPGCASGCPTRDHLRGDLEDVTGPHRGPELHVGVRREQPLVAVGADAHLGGHVAEQAQASRRRRPGCRRSARGSTARSGGASTGRARRSSGWSSCRDRHATTFFRLVTSWWVRYDATSPGVVPRAKTRSTPRSPAIFSSKRGPPTISSGRLSLG